MNKKTITINGRTYNAHTGMPLDESAAEEAPPERTSSPKRSPLHHSQNIHRSPQKSQTLNRQVVKKMTTLATIDSSKTAKPTPPVTKQHPAITKFAPHPTGYHKNRVVSDIGPSPHPHVVRAHQTLQMQKQPAAIVHKPAKAIKEEALQKAIQSAPAKSDKLVKNRQPRKLTRFASIASTALALLLLGGYFTYLNMPNLSVRVAAAQAGINASYPDYRPDGYGIKGPIGYNDGQVVIKFAANAGPQNYTISQTKSSWDSSAVLDNYVKNKAGDNYITYNERGLTIYTFDGNAAWVNGGILYTISGGAPLSSDQIRRIAVSM